MNTRQQWATVAAVVAGVAVVAVASVGVFSADLRQVTVGSEAPDFTAQTLDSVPHTRTIADFRGDVVMLNIWATWCRPCEKEMPLLQRLYEQHRAKGFRLAAVSVDAPGMAGDVRAFAQRYGLTFEVLYDSESVIARNYMSAGFPETYLIGRDGIIRRKNIGPLAEDDLAGVSAVIDQLLAEPASR